MKIDDIKIYSCFEAHPPRAEKYEAKSWQYAKSGMEEFDIVLDSRNYLIDGYCGYLLAREHGLTHIPIRYEGRWKATACHRPGGRLYCWELPGYLYGKVKPGDQLCVPGAKGETWVKVIDVMEHKPAAGEEPLKVAIHRKRRN